VSLYSNEKFVSKLKNEAGEPKYEDSMEILWRYIIGMSMLTDQYTSILEDHS
jgi:hypothetical protein